jgi:hypothetical protein
MITTTAFSLDQMEMWCPTKEAAYIIKNKNKKQKNKKQKTPLLYTSAGAARFNIVSVFIYL